MSAEMDEEESPANKVVWAAGLSDLGRIVWGRVERERERERESFV